MGYDRRKIQFPIRVVRTCPEDSKNWAGLQLADILAGAFTRHARWLNEGENIDDKFGKSITEIIGDAFPCSLLIAPEPKVTPDDLNTIGSNTFPLDYIENLLI